MGKTSANNGLFKDMNHWKRMAMAAAGGALASLAFLPGLAGAGWLFVFPGWAGLWLAASRSGFAWGMRCGFLFGLVLYGISLAWLWNIFGPVAIAMWGLLAFFTAFAGGVAGWASQRTPNAWWMPWIVAATWTATEFFRCEWFFLKFPWITPGSGLGPTWLSPWVGVYGAGFFVMLVVALAVFRPNGWRNPWVWAGFGALVVLGIFRPGPVSGNGEKIPVLLVQSEECMPARYLELTQETGFRDGYVVWPEYAVPYDIILYGEPELPAIQRWVAEQNVVLTLGTQQKLDGDRHYNLALTLGPGGILGKHAKCHPVHFMNDGIPGTRAEPVATRFGKVGTPICFDCDFTETIRRMTVHGAEWFAVPSMDAVNWGKTQHLQHAELFRHRALENGRWMAVAATSGRTQVIDPHGVVRAALPMFGEGVLRSEVEGRRELTFYTRFGWLAPWLLCGVALAGIGASWAAGRRRK
jgi:apolipoprotein N-acyltransferase